MRRLPPLPPGLGLEVERSKLSEVDEDGVFGQGLAQVGELGPVGQGGLAAGLTQAPASPVPRRSGPRFPCGAGASWPGRAAESVSRARRWRAARVFGELAHGGVAALAGQQSAGGEGFLVQGLAVEQPLRRLRRQARLLLVGQSQRQGRLLFAACVGVAEEGGFLGFGERGKDDGKVAAGGFGERGQTAERRPGPPP